MEKSVMRDVNFAYLWVILFLVASVGGMSLYYQDTYGKLAGQYKEASKELEENLALVKAKEAELRETVAEATLAKEREAVLSRKYDELRTEKESLEGELKTTQQELTALQADYEKLEADLQVAMESLTEAQGRISSLEGDVQSLYSQVVARDAIISSLYEQLESCTQE